MSALRAGAHARILTNPFLVLGLPPSAASAEIERQGQRLLLQLSAGRDGATTFSSPVGPGERTPELVRWAVDQLRDPSRRLVHELWAGIPAR